MVMPSKTQPSIVVELEGRLLVWTDGSISGDKELVALVKERVDSIHFVLAPSTDEPVKTVLDEPENRLGALAALICLHPGRTRILELDDETFIRFYGPRESLERVELTRGGLFMGTDPDA
jgi:hypothetical protein